MPVVPVLCPKVMTAGSLRRLPFGAWGKESEPANETWARLESRRKCSFKKEGFMPDAAKEGRKTAFSDRSHL